MTKQQLEARIRDLETELAQMKTLIRVSRLRGVTDYEGQYAVCPLSKQESEAVWESVMSAMLDQWAGQCKENQDVVVDAWKFSDLLPQYRKYYARVSYDSDEGLTLHKVWGLIPFNEAE